MNLLIAQEIDISSISMKNCVSAIYSFSIPKMTTRVRRLHGGKIKFGRTILISEKYFLGYKRAINLTIKLVSRK